MKGFTGAIFLILYFFIGFSGQATEPLVLFSTSKEEKISPLAKQLDEAPTLTLSMKNGGEQSACSDCTLSNLLKKPYLFFKSLDPNQTSGVAYLLENQPLSVELFGAYSTDLKDEGISQRLSAPLENGETKISSWEGSASYHIIQIPSYNVFLKGAIRMDSATHLTGPLQKDTRFLSLYNVAEHLPLNQDQEYLTYTMGLRFEKDKDIFLDLSAFETSIANPSEDDFQILYFKPVDPKQPSDIQGMEVQAGFLFRSWHGSAQYVYTRSDDLYFEDSQFLNHLGTVRLGYSPTAKLILGTALVKSGEDLFDSEKSMEVLDIYSFYDVRENARVGVIMQNVTNEPYGYSEKDSLFDRGERTLLLRLELKH